MKYFKLVFVIILLSSVQNSFSQANMIYDWNKVVLDTTIQEDILLGYCTATGLRDSLIFKEYFEVAKQEYTPTIEAFTGLMDSLSKVEITIIFGTWCSDSQREVPRVIMLLDELGYPMNRLNIIAVNRQKLFPRVDLSNYNFEFVPTIIFYKKGIEIGRIIELPVETLETDISGFLLKNI